MSPPMIWARMRISWTGAVLVVGLTGSLGVEDLPATGEATRQAARAISAALGAPD